MNESHFGDKPPWFHLTHGDAHQVEALLLGLQGAGVDVRRVRGERAKTKPTLFTEFAASLQFPSYFASNWDSFDECMSDLDWLPQAAQHIVVVFHADAIMESEPEKDLATFLEVLEGALTTLSEGDRPTHFIFQVAKASRFENALGSTDRRFITID